MAAVQTSQSSSILSETQKSHKELIQVKRDTLNKLFETISGLPSDSEQMIQIRKDFEAVPDSELDTTLNFHLAIIALSKIQKSDLVTDTDKIDFLTARRQLKNFVEEMKPTSETEPNGVCQLLSAIVERMETLI